MEKSKSRKGLSKWESGQILGFTGGKREYKGDCKISFERLREPLEGPDDGISAIIRRFCEGCGSFPEIRRSFAEFLARQAKITLPTNEELCTRNPDTGEKMSAYYFRVKHCNDCGEGYSGIELLPTINSSSN